MKQTHSTLGYQLLLVVGLVLSLMWGCSVKRLPITQQLLDSGVNFDQIPGGLDEFNIFAASPQSKAFAAAIYPDGSIHAWAKA